MAVTAQDEPLQLLMRRIGYSVGLEDLVARISMLSEMYAESGSLSYADFIDLVTERFERQKEAAEHFCNLYRSLGFVLLTGRVLYPRPNLEVLSILRRWFEDDDAAFSEAAALVITNAVIEADAEIFLNALTAEFQPAEFKALLEETITAKRSQIANVVKSKHLKRKIFEIIDIRTPGKTARALGAPADLNKSRFAKRATTLSSGSRREALSGGGSVRPDIDDSYLRHVPKNRTSWAIDLGYMRDGALTPRGQALLKAMAQLGLRREKGCYVFWPYQADLARLRIDAESLAPTVSHPWDLLAAIAGGLSGISVVDREDDDCETIETLRRIFTMYREGNRGRGSIRHQVPLSVALPCFVALCSARRSSIQDLELMLGRENSRSHRRVNRVIIRGTEGGLQFPEKT